jgi:hypothetical protein
MTNEEIRLWVVEYTKRTQPDLSAVKRPMADASKDEIGMRALIESLSWEISQETTPVSYSRPSNSSEA